MSGQVRLEGLGFSHGDHVVLDGLEVTIGAGERVAVLGRSGAGKTTLLRLIAGLEVPSRGAVHLGQTQASAPGKVLVAPQSRGVGFVFQGLALWDHMTVAQTLAFASGGQPEPALELAARVGLGGRLDARPHQLSGGERQRLALIRALASRPRVLLLDEPFAHLDTPLRAELGAELLRLAGELELTLILVTHLAADALELAERVLVLEGGRLADELPLTGALIPRHRTTCELLDLGNAVAGEIKEGKLHTAIGALSLREGAPATGPALAFVPPEVLRVFADEAGVGEARRWVTPTCGGAAPVAVALDGGGRLLRGYASQPLAPGTRVRVEVEAAVDLLQG